MNLDPLIYCAYRLGGEIAPRLPSRFGYRLAEGVGSLVFRRAASRRVVEDNVSHIIGQPPDSPQVQTIARQIFRNQAKNYFDLLRLSSLTPQAISGQAREITGLEHLDRALARGRGVVLVSAHFGNFDLAGQVLALRGYRVTGVAEHLRPERLFRYICRLRQSHGLRYVPIDRWLRPVFRALAANEIVALAIDRNVTDPGRLVEFFGQPARLPDGYLRLALRTRAALILGFCLRLGDDSFRIIIEPELELERTGDADRDIESNMRRALDVFRGHLSRHPEQWVFFQPVWLPKGPATEP